MTSPAAPSAVEEVEAEWKRLKENRWDERGCVDWLTPANGMYDKALDLARRLDAWRALAEKNYSGAAIHDYTSGLEKDLESAEASLREAVCQSCYGTGYIDSDGTCGNCKLGIALTDHP